MLEYSTYILDLVPSKVFLRQELLMKALFSLHPSSSTLSCINIYNYRGKLQLYYGKREDKRKISAIKTKYKPVVIMYSDDKTKIDRI